MGVESPPDRQSKSAVGHHTVWRKDCCSGLQCSPQPSNRFRSSEVGMVEKDTPHCHFEHQNSRKIQLVPCIRVCRMLSTRCLHLDRIHSRGSRYPTRIAVTTLG